MLWLFILCILLGIAVIVLLIKLFLMRRAAEEIAMEFTEKLADDTNTLISLSSRDKAMRRLAEEINVQLRKLRSQRHRFCQGDMELKNAVTNISHDLRTPLTAICGYLDLLDKEEKSEAVSRYLEIIKNRTGVLQQLTGELFRYSVITSPEYGNEIEKVAVNGVLEESIAGFYPVLRERGITPDIQITEKRVVRKVNKEALSRIFSNLLSNGVKYSSGDLHISLSDMGELVFSNLAPSLDRVQVERLFDRFYTVETARKSTGLGLSIAKILTEQMGGEIRADYEEGRLSIRIFLPEEGAEKQEYSY